jgi:hypothetical protein
METDIELGYVISKDNDCVEISLYKEGGIYFVEGFIGLAPFRKCFDSFNEAEKYYSTL